MAHPILLYDGVCGLCNRLNQFVLKRDPRGIFRFASLQSSLAGRILERQGADARDLDTVYVVLNHDPRKEDGDQPDETLLMRSDAIIFVLRQLRGFWGMASRLIQLLPRPVRDWGYNRVARNRYRIFGRYDACMLPSSENRERFMDV